MKVFTDYPIVELGDIENKIAPIRKVELISYDGDKYAYVIAEGYIVSFKACYLYTAPVRCGKGKRLPKRILKKYIGLLTSSF